MLTSDEVRIWYVFSDAVRDPHVLARYAAMLTPDERTRRDRFVFERDRHQFLVTRGMVRTLLGAALGIDPAACRFVANPYGRPSLAQPEGGTRLEFNLSHTRGLVACALALGREVGLDVEHVDRAPLDPGLARRFFSPLEVAALEALPPGARASRFFDYWTLKEAYIKARGLGLSLPLDGFSMQLDDPGPPRIAFAAAVADDPLTWQFARFSPGPRHRMAVAVRRHGPDLPIRVRELVFSEL